jgi:hypothetical protein
MKRLSVLCWFLTAASFSCIDSSSSPSGSAGSGWERTAGPNAVFTCLAAAESSLYAAGSGLSKSTDNGTSWSYHALPAPISGVAAVTVCQGYLFVGGDGFGVYRSADGVNWYPANTGLVALKNFVNTLIARDSVLLAGTEESGVFRSTDGLRWTEANNGIPSPLVSAMLVKGNLVFVAAPPGIVGTDRRSGGVFRTTNDGITWSGVSSGLTDSSVYSLAATSTRLFAATASGLFASTDDGEHWSNIAPDVAAHTIASDGRVLYAVVGRDIRRSIDDGVHWESISGELQLDPSSSAAISFAVNEKYFFAGAGTSVWRHRR